MTLRSRNRIFFIFYVFSCVCLFLSVFHFVLAGFNSEITPPEDTVRLINIFSSTAAGRPDFYAAIAGIFAFTLYVPIVACSVWRGFEKTQSIEVIYFELFLLGCLTEALRIVLAMNGVWKTSSTTLLFIGRFVMSGRMLSPLSLLFASLFSENDQRQNVERNIFIVLILSILTGLSIPLDTYHIASSITVLWGTRTLFSTVRILLAVISFVCLIINAATKYSSESGKLLSGYAILIIGYGFMCSCDCWLFFGLGALGLSAGTYIYLRSVHGLYLWR